MLPLLNEYYDKILADAWQVGTARQNILYCTYFGNWYGSENIKKVTRKDIEKYKLYLMTEYKTRLRKTKLSNSAIANRLYALKGYFKFLQNRKVLFLDPTVGLEVPKVIKFANVDCLTEKEVQELIRKPDTRAPLGVRDRLIFELFYTSALRSNELCRLKLSEVDMKEKYIYPSRSKGGRECGIPIVPTTYQVLKKYLSESRPELVKKSGKPDPEEVFITRRGVSMTVYTVNKIFEKYREGDKHIHPHALRHTCATHMIKNGADIRNVQALLGHNSLETTQGYTKLTVENLKDIHEKYHPRERMAKRKTK